MWTLIGLCGAAVIIIGFSILHTGKRAEKFAAPERKMHGCCIKCGHGCTADEMDRCSIVERERCEMMDEERWDGLS